MGMSDTQCKEQAAVPPYYCVSGILLLHPPLSAEDLCLAVRLQNLQKYSSKDAAFTN
jgi:hypothetical protein